MPVDELSNSSNHLDFGITDKASFERDLRGKVRNYVLHSVTNYNKVHGGVLYGRIKYYSTFG